MIRWLARALLFRVLPRRLLPILTVIEIARFVRGLRRPKTAVNEPVASRTGPPPPLPPPTPTSSASPPPVI
jgi:hypothetical protein